MLCTLALSLGVLTLAACSHKQANTPISYVPANTPYVIASLKPLDSDTLKGFLTQADAQMPAQLAQLRSSADRLAEIGKPHMAAVLRELASEFDGRNVEQTAARMGLDLHALSAVYGLGMSPVARFQIADPAKFQAFIGRLEKAWGTPLQTSTLDSLSYQHVEFGKKLRLQMILAVQKKQAVMALLPASADKDLLRQALGLKRPVHSMSDSEALEKLADSKDYQPYVIGELDLQKLPKLITGNTDPMVNAIVAAAKPGASGNPLAACQGDFARIAARVPRISFGYTTLEAKHMASKVNVDLAPDISKALSGISAKLPGLGGDLDAPMDLAMALPVQDLRQFWISQADAVAAKPFSCPALSDLNKGFSELRSKIRYTAVPPFNGLRGLRISIDSLQMPDSGHGRPQFSGRFLIASSNPQGLLALAAMRVPQLSSLNLKKDGKPVALPAQLTAMTGSNKPAWAAMNDDALVIGYGQGEDAKASAELNDDEGQPGTFLRMHVSGTFYQQYMKLISKFALAKLDKSSNPKNEAAMKDMQRSLQAAQEQAKRIESVAIHTWVDEHGLVIASDVKMH
jgi:hypothetical protein